MTIGKNALSAAARVRRFFQDNPDELLTIEDVSVKFGISSNYAVDLMKRLAADGQVKRWRMFGKGPTLKGAA